MYTLEIIFKLMDIFKYETIGSNLTLQIDGNSGI